PAYRENPERLLRHRQWPQSQVRPLADQGLNMTSASPVKKDAVVELTARDLNANGGVLCPSPSAGMKLWNSHPRGQVRLLRHRLQAERRRALRWWALTAVIAALQSTVGTPTWMPDRIRHDSP